MQSNETCPKCGSAARPSSHSPAFDCGSFTFEDGTLWEEDCELVIARNTIAALRRELADARLLAKAALHDMADTDGATVYVYNQPSGNRFEATIDTDGLPILTDELRTALRKAIGEA